MFHPGCHFGGGWPDLTAGRFLERPVPAGKVVVGLSPKYLETVNRLPPAPLSATRQGPQPSRWCLARSSIKAACKDESTIFTYSTSSYSHQQPP